MTDSARLEAARESSRSPPALGLGGALRLAVEVVRLGGHDEVVAVQPPDLVGPPLDADAAPLEDETGVVALQLGLATDSLGELQRVGEVAEPEAPLDPGDAVRVGQTPTRAPWGEAPRPPRRSPWASRGDRLRIALWLRSWGLLLRQYRCGVHSARLVRGYTVVESSPPPKRELVTSEGHPFDWLRAGSQTPGEGIFRPTPLCTPPHIGSLLS